MTFSKLLSIVMVVSLTSTVYADSLKDVHSDLLSQLGECFVNLDTIPMFKAAFKHNSKARKEHRDMIAQVAKLKRSMLFTWSEYDKSDAAQNINYALFDRKGQLYKPRDEGCWTFGF